jgi:hypothetical protein
MRWIGSAELLAEVAAEDIAALDGGADEGAIVEDGVAEDGVTEEIAVLDGGVDDAATDVGELELVGFFEPLLPPQAVRKIEIREI